MARARRRVIALGIWVAYFGVLAVVLGLYALNAAALSRRTIQMEHQTARARQMQGAAGNLKIGAQELAQVESYILNSRRWHDRLSRLAAILPPNVRLASMTANPDRASGTEDADKLVITGLFRPAPGEDRMQGVMKIVSTIHSDSLLKTSYRNVRLASTRVIESGDGAAEFVIECR